MRWLGVVLISSVSSVAVLVTTVFTVAWAVFRFNPAQFVTEVRGYIHADD